MTATSATGDRASATGDRATASATVSPSVVPPGLAATNPVTRLAAALLVAVVLVASVDVVSAGVALALELVLLLAVARVPPATLVRRTAPVWIAAPLAALTIALYGEPSGREHLAWLLVRVTDGSLELALATLLRVLAIGVPAVGLLIAVDPTDLADGLAQRVHLPARFVLGALAAFRLVGLFAEDWKALALARRARGVAEQGRVRRLGGQAFALLVLSVRRGSTLATAMEARGFGAPGRRTWARPSRFGWADGVLVALAVAVVAVAITASVVTGAWNPILVGRA